MPKSSVKLINQRKNEIIDACEKLYRTKSFKDITLKEIVKHTTFTRTLIYHYFHTKEEIFLSIGKKEYELWEKDLKKIIKDNISMSKDEIADCLAASLQKRSQMLKLMSMSHFDTEANSRLEILTEFKIAFGSLIKTLRRLLEKFLPDMTKKDIDGFIYAFFPFIYGIYPYTAVSEKQKEAMKNANVGFIYHNIYELAYPCIKKLLK